MRNQQRDKDFAWIRQRLDRAKVKNVQLGHIARFYELCDRDKEMTAACLATIVAGRPYIPLRDKLEAARLSSTSLPRTQ